MFEKLKLRILHKGLLLLLIPLSLQIVLFVYLLSNQLHEATEYRKSLMQKVAHDLKSPLIL